MSNRRRPRVTHPLARPATSIKTFRTDWAKIEREGTAVIVLERIVEGVDPDYCIHGRCTCRNCDHWCWLGDETHKIVETGEVMPLCKECATVMIPPDAVKVGPIERANDHRRADGPH